MRYIKMCGAKELEENFSLKEAKINLGPHQIFLIWTKLDFSADVFQVKL